MFHPDRWPRRPYVSTDKRSQAMKPLVEALDYQHIQINWPGAIAWLGFDVDLKDAAKRCLALGLLDPTWITTNPVSTHGHVIYGISIPVSRRARGVALAFLEDVRRYLTLLLGADPHYTAHLTQNPLHPAWTTTWSGHLYSLDELVRSVREHPHLAGLLKRDAENSAKHEGLDYAAGRNCAAFHGLRFWAYDAIGDYYAASDARGFNAWGRACEARVFEISPRDRNGTPLPDAELRVIARSVARWVWDHRRRHVEYVQSTHTSEKQRVRGVLSGRARKLAAAPRTVRVIELHEQGQSAASIAVALRVSESTVWRDLRTADPRQKALPNAF